MAVKIVSINAKGLNSPFKRSMIWKEVRSQRADILCIQETHFKASSPPRLRDRNFPHIFLACTDKKKAGVAIAIRDSVTFQTHQAILDPGGRFIILVCEVDSVKCTLVNVYAPNSRQIAFLNKVKRKVERVKQGALIWCGDFNAIVDPSLDSTSKCSTPPVQIQPWLLATNLYDIWRCRHATEKDFTFYSNPHKIFSRIDLFLTDSLLLSQIVDCSIGTITWSDHAPISLSVSFSQSRPAPFSWRNNTYILSNPTHQSVLANKLNEYFSLNSTSSVSEFTVWSAHKAYMRGVLIQLSSRLKKDKSKNMQDLLSTIRRLETLQRTAPTRATHEELCAARLGLRQHLLSDYEYQLKRSKVKYYHSINKPSKLMAKRVASVKGSTRIPYLISSSHNGKLYDPQAIADEFSNFYLQLYNLRDDPSIHNPSLEEMESFLAPLALPTLSVPQLNDLNAPITESEICAVIKSLPRGKAPGPDGFSNEYYRTFSSILTPHLCTTFNLAMSTGSVPAEFLQATVITLPKPGKPSDTPANFRPISLLNSDIKLYAKLLANRLLRILPLLIDPDQVGFVKGRQAPDGTRRLINLISRLQHIKSPAIFLSLDAEKAFDRIHWDFVFKTLSKFGFEGPILSAIGALYTNPTARVLANGVLSRPFNITNGTRQGCPLSPLIFALVMEPLAEIIRTRSEIKGISIAQSQHKINLFADDVILTLTDIESSLSAVTEVLCSFGKVSYYKVNPSKSMILGFHVPLSVKTNLQTRYPYGWSASSIPYLGVHLTNNPSLLCEANFPPLMRNIQLDLDRIARIDNSWLGRIVIYKMIIFPKILYVLRALPIPIPTMFFTRLHSQMSKYIWVNKKPRLSFQTMTRRLDLGGLGLPDLKAYHRAVTLDQARYWWHNSTEKKWVDIESAIAGRPNWKAVLLDPLPTAPVLKATSLSISATLKYWRDLLRGKPPMSGVTQRSVPIECALLHIPNMSLDSWKNKGIATLDALYDGSRLRTFSELQSLYNLPDTDHFKVTQITHMLSNLSSRQCEIPTRLTPLLQDEQTTLIKGSRVFYDLVTGNDMFGKTQYMVKWESDLGTRFSDIQWSKAIYQAHHSSACANQKEQYQKLLTRWYFTPLRIAKAYVTASPYCWRSCGSVGSLLHIFWSCPSLRPFWSEVSSLISAIHPMSKPLNPELALLLLGIDGIPKSYRVLISNILHAARLTIARHWKSTESPTLMEVKNIVSNIYMHERTLAWHKGSNKIFQSQWSPWSTFMPITANTPLQIPPILH